MPPAKSWKFYWKLFNTSKVLENNLGSGKSSNLLAIMRTTFFWFQIGMFLQTKIAIIVANRYVFWDAGKPKMLSRLVLCPRPRWAAYSAPQTP